MLPTPGQPAPGSRGRRGAGLRTGSCLGNSVSCSGLMRRGHPAQSGGDGGDTQLRCRGVEVAATKPEIEDDMCILKL